MHHGNVFAYTDSSLRWKMCWEGYNLHSMILLYLLAPSFFSLCRWCSGCELVYSKKERLNHAITNLPLNVQARRCSVLKKEHVLVF